MKLIYPQNREKEFFETFGVELREYWEPSFGFDIVRFDAEVVGSGDASPEQICIAKFGRRANQLIVEIIHEEAGEIAPPDEPLLTGPGTSMTQ